LLYSKLSEMKEDYKILLFLFDGLKKYIMILLKFSCTIVLIDVKITFSPSDFEEGFEQNQVQ
jgi:hypothetical protein